MSTSWNLKPKSKSKKKESLSFM